MAVCSCHQLGNASLAGKTCTLYTTLSGYRGCDRAFHFIILGEKPFEIVCVAGVNPSVEDVVGHDPSNGAHGTLVAKTLARGSYISDPRRNQVTLSRRRLTGMLVAVMPPRSGDALDKAQQGWAGEQAGGGGSDVEEGDGNNRTGGRGRSIGEPAVHGNAE